MSQLHPSFPSFFAFLVSSFPEQQSLQVVFSHNTVGLHYDVHLVGGLCVPNFLTHLLHSLKTVLTCALSPQGLSAEADQIKYYITAFK